VGRTYLYAVRASDPERDPLQFTLLSAPRGNMTLGATSGLLRWTPDAADAGAAVPVVIQVADGQGNLATQRFEIEVGTNAGNLPTNTNSPPVITSTPVYRATLDRPYVYSAAARDPEGAVVSWSLREPPVGMTIDGATGKIEWIPTAAGEQLVTVIATDPLGARAIQSYLLLTARNEAPQITSTPPTTAVAGGLYRYDVSARDPEGDPLQYTLIAPPSGMTIDSVGRLRWNVPSTSLTPVNVVVEVADAFGATARQTFAITPTADVTPPRLKLVTSSQTVDSQGRVVVDLGTPLLFQVQSTDDVGMPTLSLTVDGVALPLDTGASARWTVSRVGAVTVVATATDAAGNVSSQTLALRVRDPNDSDAPFVEIVSPSPLVDTNLVSYLTKIIGTVRDDNLLSWRLDYALSDAVDFFNDVAGQDPDWVTFATGNSNVNSAALGVFDPTVLANGQYVVRVFAEDTSGLITVRGVLLGVQGEAKLGNFRLEFTDLQIPVAGIPITVTRVYDTLHAREEGDFGYGWRLGLRDANIRETVPDNGGDFFTQYPFQNGTRVYLTDPDGKRIGFTFQPEFRSALLFAIARPRFIPDPGVTATLEDADLQDFALFQGKDGSYHGFFGVGNYNPENYILTTSNGVRYHYNEDQGLRKVVDRNGNTLTFDDAGIHSSGGDEVLFTRDGRGRITAITDPNGNQLHYTYNAAGDLVSFRDQVDLRTTFSYLTTPAHYLDEIHDPLGRRASKTIYGPDGRVQKIIDALGNETRQSFDSGAFTGTITDAKGNVTKLVYDQRGNVVREEDAEGGVTLREYADAANPDKETKVTRLGENGRQIVTRYSYDPRGNRTTVTDSFGTTRFEYDVLGNVLKTIDALGRVTTATYNAQGQMTTLINALGDSTARTYDSNGRVATVTDFLGHTTQMKYEPGCPCGIPSEVINPDGTRRFFEANEFGQITLATDEVGITALTLYDDGGRVVAERGPQGQEVRYFYTGNQLSRKEVQIDATHVRTTVYTYFDDGKLKSETDALGGVVRSTYDKNGNLETLTDPENNLTRFVYDKNNRLIEEVDPLGQSIKYKYDQFGNRFESIDRLGRKRTYDFDDAGRMLSETWWLNDRVERVFRYTFDAIGNLLTATDADSQVTKTYDALNQVISTDNLGTLGAPHIVLRNVYDSNGQRISVTDNLGVSVLSTYDRRGWLETRSWSGLPTDNPWIEFSYLPNGRMATTQRFINGPQSALRAATEFAYDQSGRVGSITHSNGNGAAIATYQYSYDAANQITNQIYEASEGRFHANYGYDLFGQLTQVDYLNDELPDELYRYDLNGNRTSARVLGMEQRYSVLPGNRYSGDSQATYQYDLAGNLIAIVDKATGQTIQRTYDYRNRLTGSETRSAAGIIINSFQIVYDALDNKIRTTSVDSGSNTISVIHDVIDGIDVWSSTDQTAGSLTRYLVGDRIDGHLATWSGNGAVVGSISWPLVDRLGSIRDIVRGDVSPLSHVSIDTFGNFVGPTSQPLERFLLTGREYIQDLDLHFFRSRFYDSSLGRWTVPDLYGFGAGDPNLYRFVFNQPSGFADPFGDTSLIEAGLTRAQSAAVTRALAKIGCTVAVDAFLQNAIYIFVSGQPYVGMTSRSIEARIFEHNLNKFKGEAIHIATVAAVKINPAAGPAARRYVEQTIINALGGIGNLRNSINSIAPSKFPLIKVASPCL
jgi:RHS repeat-associated protein